MRNTLAIFLTLAAMAGPPALARDPSFVSPAQSHSFEILPSPPAADSATTRAELEELHQIEAKRTDAEAAQAIWDDKNEHLFIFKSVFGDIFTPENLPLTAAFGKRVKNDEGINTDVAKTGFHRVRPYNLDATLHAICATKTKDDSYPSGHTTSGFLLALALTDMVPERRDEIFARAEDYAHNRLVCGVHYSSDLEASRKLAYAIHAMMAQNPQYQAELAPARAELRAALGMPAAK